MGLQKYRADTNQIQSDGAKLWFARWMGGPTLAKVENCRIENRSIGNRTVYVTGDADSWFSLPAACVFKRKTIRGYLATDDNGLTVFRARDGYLEEFRQ